MVAGHEFIIHFSDTKGGILETFTFRVFTDIGENGTHGIDDGLFLFIDLKIFIGYILLWLIRHTVFPN